MMKTEGKNYVTTLLVLFIAGLFFCVYWAEHQLRLDAVATVQKQKAEIAELQSKLQTTEKLQKLHRDEIEKVAKLEKVESGGSINTPIHPAPTAAAKNEQPAMEENHADSSGDSEYRARARLSAIEKFVSLTAEQREQLQQRFLIDAKSGTDTLSFEEGVDDKDPLAEVIGEENAKYYREQVRSTFERVEEEAREKEILLYTRKLALDSSQEQRFRETVNQIDSELREKSRSAARGRLAKRSMSERVQEMVAENRQRNDLLRERLKAVFTPEQLAAFEQELARSPEQDFEMWHAPE